MPHVEPVSASDAVDQRLQAALDDFEVLGDPDATFVRVLAHAPGYAKALWDAMRMALFDGGVDHTMKEIIRIQLATTAGDPYFATLRSKRALADGLTEDRIQAGIAGFEDDPQFTAAERWALRYTHLMYREPERLDAAFYEEGKRHWSEAQIMEIGGLTAVHYGLQMFMRTLAD